MKDVEAGQMEVVREKAELKLKVIREFLALQLKLEEVRHKNRMEEIKLEKGRDGK